MKTIIIAGMPASGKTTAAKSLSEAFGFPILEKDAIKEELFDVIGFWEYAQKRLMDVAATAVLLRCADSLLGSGSSLILVNNFRDTVQPQVQEMLNRRGCQCVTVFFSGDADVFYKRYVERDLRHERHLGHVLQDRYPPLPGDPLEYTMSREEFAEKFEKLGMADFRIDGPRIEVDATYPERIDMDKLISEIHKAFESMDIQQEKEKKPQ